MFIDFCLLGLMAAAVAFDIKTRRIPNLLILAGLSIAIVYYGYTGGWDGLLLSIKGFLLGILLLLLPFITGGMGAGDVKLLGMIGAMKGSLFVFNTFIWMALWGGLIVVIILIKEKRMKEFLAKLKASFLMLVSRCGLIQISDNFEKKHFSLYFPYGLAIGLGVASCFIKGWC